MAALVASRGLRLVNTLGDFFLQGAANIWATDLPGRVPVLCRARTPLQRWIDRSLTEEQVSSDHLLTTDK